MEPPHEDEDEVHETGVGEDVTIPQLHPALLSRGRTGKGPKDYMPLASEASLPLVP